MIADITQVITGTTRTGRFLWMPVTEYVLLKKVNHWQIAVIEIIHFRVAVTGNKSTNTFL